MDKWLVKVKYMPCDYWKVYFATVTAASKRQAKAKAEADVCLSISGTPYKIKAVKAIKLLEGE